RRAAPIAISVRGSAMLLLPRSAMGSLLSKSGQAVRGGEVYRALTGSRTTRTRISGPSITIGTGFPGPSAAHSLPWAEAVERSAKSSGSERKTSGEVHSIRAGQLAGSRISMFEREPCTWIFDGRSGPIKIRTDDPTARTSHCSGRRPLRSAVVDAKYDATPRRIAVRAGARTRNVPPTRPGSVILNRAGPTRRPEPADALHRWAANPAPATPCAFSTIACLAAGSTLTVSDPATVRAWTVTARTGGRSRSIE